MVENNFSQFRFSYACHIHYSYVWGWTEGSNQVKWALGYSSQIPFSAQRYPFPQLSRGLSVDSSQLHSTLGLDLGWWELSNPTPTPPPVTALPWGQDTSNNDWNGSTKVHPPPSFNIEQFWESLPAQSSLKNCLRSQLQLHCSLSPSLPKLASFTSSPAFPNIFPNKQTSSTQFSHSGDLT